MMEIKKRIKAKVIQNHNPNRDKFERWLDKHNHKLELIRTIGNFLTGLVALLVILGVHI